MGRVNASTLTTMFFVDVHKDALQSRAPKVPREMGEVLEDFKIDSKVEGDEVELVSAREAPGKIAEGAYFQTRHHPHFNLTIAVEGR